MTVDRRYGVVDGVAVKAPVRVATTANITLAGEQTIDTVACVENDAVLVKDQTVGTQNGIYLVSTGNWVRRADFDGNLDAVRGTRVWVNGEGTLNKNLEFVLTTVNPVVIDASTITFVDFEVLMNAAPGNAQYIVAAANSALTAERVATDTATVIWNFGTTSQALASVPAATTSAPGVSELATSAEAITGTDTTRTVTPAALAATIAAVSPALPRGYLDVGAAANGTDATNDINFPGGVCRSSDNTANITLAAMAGKQLDANWAPGANAGMRNSAASITNGTYHCYGAAKADGTQDYYATAGVAGTDADASATITAMLTALNAEGNRTGAAYVTARRVISIVRASAAIIGFTQIGNEIWMNTPILDCTHPTPGTTANTTTIVSVPLGIKALAKFNATSGAILAYVTPLFATDTAPSGTVAPLATYYFASGENGGRGEIITDLSAQIRFRMGSNNAFRLSLQSYVDQLGRNR